MSKLTKNEKGFSAIELIMIVVIVVLIGGLGYIVYKNKHQPTKVVTVTKTVVAPTKSNTATTKDPYSGWNTTTLKYEQISYKYPTNWTITDKSSAMPKSQNSCIYPGHDLITLTSPTGTQMNFNAGQDCFGDGGAQNFGSAPIYSLGSSIYLAFLANTGPYTPTSPSEACLSPITNPSTSFALKSKNIFFNGPGTSSDPVNAFCFIPYNPSNYQTSVPGFTISQIENSSDYKTAKLIFESMHY